jgi:hypothetical protein
MGNISAILTGSLHAQNIGDFELVKSFLKQHEYHYRNEITILGFNPDKVLEFNNQYPFIDPPKLAIGHRFYYGVLHRLEIKNQVLSCLPNSSRHYIWLGGLLSKVNPHMIGRYKELKWASQFSDKFIYYFGDVGTGFSRDMNSVKKLVRKIDSYDNWLAVRSTEAASLLVDAGLKSNIHVGIDAVLYDRCMSRGLPFKRIQTASETLTIIVCGYLWEQSYPIYIAAAQVAVALGLRIRLVSLCNLEDLPICEQLAEKISTEHPSYPIQIVSDGRSESLIAESAVCIATRFHGAIFALAAGVPTIAVPYDAKVERLFKLLQLDEWIADPKLNPQPSGFWHEKLKSMIKSGLADEFKPNYQELLLGITAHQAALADFQKHHESKSMKV